MNLKEALNRAQAMQNALGYAATFAFDPVGRNVGVQDANGNWTTMGYDARGLLVRQEDPNGRLTTYVYDAVGSRTVRMDGNGIATTSTYDALRREVFREYPSGHGTSATFTYDPLGRRASVQAIGPGHTEAATWTYDPVGRLKSVVPFSYGVGLSYNYDPVGNRAAMVEAGAGACTTYTYDAANNITQLVNPAGEATTFVYDPLSREASRLTANDQLTARAYDPSGRETSKAIALSGTPIGVYTASYDSVGNRLSVAELAASATYAYDAANQLTSELRSAASDSYFATYTYDLAGNRTAMAEAGSSTTYAYDPANQLLSITQASAVTTQTYDGAGNLIAQNAGGTVTSMLWDAENRMVQAGDSAGETLLLTYSVDGLLQDAIPQYSSDNTSYAWDGQNLYLEETAPTLSRNRFTNLPQDWGGLISQASIFSVSSFYGSDLSSNMRLVTSDGAVSGESDFTAFGQTLAASNTQIGFGGDVGYLMGILNAQLPWIYVRARWYDPATGRWVSRDPIGFKGGDWNLFRYVGNSPVVGVDPSGLVVGCNYAAFSISSLNRPAPRFNPHTSWNKSPKTKTNVLAHAAIVNNPAPTILGCLAITNGASMTCTTRWLEWLSNSGNEWNVSPKTLFSAAPSAKENCTDMLQCAMSFAEANLTSGSKISILSNYIGGAISPDENNDWYEAIGSYKQFAQANVTMCGDVYNIVFTWRLEDIETFGKFHDFGPVQFFDWHKEGIAQDYWTTSQYRKSVTWRKGQRMGYRCG